MAILKIDWVIIRKEYYHPDPHIKRPEHFFVGDIAESLDEAEDGWFGPGAAVYFDGDAVG